MPSAATIVSRLAVALGFDWETRADGQRGQLSEPGGVFAALVVLRGRRAEMIGEPIGEAPQHRGRYAPAPSITVSLDRPLGVLARDVERRLVLPYRHVYAPEATARAERQRATTAEIGRVEREVERLSAARFGRGVRREREAVRFAYRTPREPYATLRVAVSAPDRVAVELDGLTAEAALALLQQLHDFTSPTIHP